jgi:hypothetical protein
MFGRWLKSCVSWVKYLLFTFQIFLEIDVQVSSTSLSAGTCLWIGARIDPEQKKIKGKW